MTSSVSGREQGRAQVSAGGTAETWTSWEGSMCKEGTQKRG